MRSPAPRFKRLGSDAWISVWRRRAGERCTVLFANRLSGCGALCVVHEVGTVSARHTEQEAQTMRPRWSFVVAVVTGMTLAMAACGSASPGSIAPRAATATDPTSQPTVHAPATTTEPWRSSAALVPRTAAASGGPLGYYEYLPPRYGDGDPSPLLIFLHGKDEHGDGSEAALDRLFADGGSIPELINRDEWPADRPFVVLAPQHTGPANGERYAGCFERPLPGDCALPIQSENGHPEKDSICHRPAAIHEFIAYALDTYDIDPDRVYLTGLSCGGYASFEYAAEYGASQIAAMIPIAGEGRLAWDRVGCALGDVPIWAFHGDADDEISPAGSIEPLTKLADCPSAENHKLTIYPGGDHNSWARTYDLSAGNDVYTWLLGFTRP